MEGTIIESSRVITSSWMEKNFYSHSTDSDIKRYKDIRKLTIREGENYTTEYLLDYECIKNCYRLKKVDLSQRKEFDANLKAI